MSQFNGGSNDERKKELLKGALFEYVDDGMVDELIDDIREVIEQEEERLKQYLSACKKARKLLCRDKGG